MPGWVTDEVLTLLGGLTPKQRQGIVRIVEAELAGESLASLFEGKGRICTETTYYRAKPPGWHRQGRFQEALKAARASARAFGMENAVQEAMQVLTISAPAAARELQRQVGDGERDSDKRSASNSILDRLDKTAPRQVDVFDMDGWMQDRQARLAAVEALEEVAEG